MCRFQVIDEGCGRCAKTRPRVLQAAVGACCASTAAAASMPRAAGGWGRSALRVAQGRPVNANRVALMAQPTEERLDERFVAEKHLPFRVVQIRCNQCRPSAVALLHQLEEDVRLLGFEIEIAQFVNKCGASHLLTNGERSEMWRSVSGSPMIPHVSSQTLHITFP